MNSTINLKEYLDKAKDGAFVIPDYQRGYVWGKEHKDRKDSVTFLIETLLEAFKNNKEVFLQGITVHEDNKNIVVVDGQQRTTFFFLLLKWLNYQGKFEIFYKVRDKSDEFLQNLNAQKVASISVSEDEEYQDVYFFKKSLNIFRQADIGDKQKFLYFILEKVRFLYIEIPADKAYIVFTMMNGNKALMKDEELIKSELLRCSSLKIDEIGEGENSMIRSRLSREWDKWLYWWKDPKVVEFFRTEEKILGWLLPLNFGKKEVFFKEYCDKKLKEKSVKEAKAVFKELRLLQKSIEDAYNDPVSYNYVGGILRFTDNNDDRFRFLSWYFSLQYTKKEREKWLKRYFYLSLVGVNHTDKINHFDDKIDEFREKLADEFLYKNHYGDGARWLLRCNIEQDCKSGDGGRKFNFSIWNNISLEHIFPKSKVFHWNEGNALVNGNEDEIDKSCLKDPSYLSRDDIKNKEEKATEHCIGNLVLLYKNENSKFGNKDFDQKKEIFFNPEETDFFYSRHLLHTVSVFARSKWDAEEIAKQYKNILSDFDKQYEQYKQNNNDDE